MKKWIATSAAMAVLLSITIAGCGAKMPTVAESAQEDQYDSKLEFNTDYVGQDQVIEAVD